MNDRLEDFAVRPEVQTSLLPRDKQTVCVSNMNGNLLQQDEPLCSHKAGFCSLSAIGRIAISVFDPRKLAHSYFVMLLLCFARLGIVFCIDTPAPLEGAIISVMNVDVTRYELLNSLYSWPNVVVPVLGGILIDKVFGLRLGFLIFFTIGCLGLAFVSLGAYLNWFWLMLVGRFVYGGGGEIAALCVDIFAASLFKKEKLSFVFGLIYSFGRLGSVLNLNLTGRLYSALGFLTDHNARLGSVLLLAFVVCTTGLIVGFIATLLHYRREKVLREKRKTQRGFRLEDLKDFSLPFWLLLLASGLFFILIFAFVGIAQLFFERKYAYSTDTANSVNGLLYVIPIFCPPLFGLLFDWLGYKVFCGLIGVVVALTCHVVFAFTGQVYFIPILTMLAMGVSYSIYTTAVWPLVFQIVQEHQYGTAYGVLNCGTQLFEAVSVIIVGVIVDWLGYLFVELFFAALGSISFVLLFVLYTTSGGQELNISGVKRRLLKRAMESKGVSVNHPNTEE